MKEKIQKRKEDRQGRSPNYHIMFALKAAREAEKVLHFFEDENPEDKRPRKAIEAIKEWAHGKRELNMAEVRELSLGSHEAAREAKSDAARFAAQAAGHAVATWHVTAHSLRTFSYSQKAMSASKNAKKSG